jgi:hypothetical protein
VFQSGFQGPAELAIVDVNTTGKRTGLLSLTGRQKFTLADLPAMPPDVTGFSASSISWNQIYPVGMKAAEVIVGLVAPDKLEEMKTLVKDVEKKLGMKIHDDLLAHLDDLTVQYGAWPEGPLGLGTVTAIKVKNAAKLEQGISRLLQGLSNLGPVTVSVKTHKYRDAVIKSVRVSTFGPEFQFASYTIYKDWLIYAGYPFNFFGTPQPLQGFILRGSKELPGWKANAEIQKILDGMPKEMVAIQISDPRPGIKGVLSVAPTLVALVNMMLEQAPIGFKLDLEVNLIPNAYEATQHLFPNVIVTSDNGTRERTISRMSVFFPF